MYELRLREGFYDLLGPNGTALTSLSRGVAYDLLARSNAGTYDPYNIVYLTVDEATLLAGEHATNVQGYSGEHGSPPTP